jgi:hypothetical protein
VSGPVSWSNRPNACAWRIAKFLNISCDVAILLGSLVRDLAVLFLHLLTTAARHPAAVHVHLWVRPVAVSRHSSGFITGRNGPRVLRLRRGGR